MILIPVSSRVIAAIGYEAGVLALLFHNGGLYYYRGVPVRLYLSFIVAGSKGRFYNARVRGHYR